MYDKIQPGGIGQ